MDWRCGSSDRVPALQVKSLKFKPQSHQKNKMKDLEDWFKRKSTCLASLNPWVQIPVPPKKKRKEKKKWMIESRNQDPGNIDCHLFFWVSHLGFMRCRRKGSTRVILSVSVLVSSFVTVTNIWDKQLIKRKGFFWLTVWRFQSRNGWPCCFRPHTVCDKTCNFGTRTQKRGSGRGWGP
jgi:hypothetical protein